MKDLLWEVKYELVRSLKHIFYVLLAVCWFAFWYALASLIINDWNIENWHKDNKVTYWWCTGTGGIIYLVYRITDDH